MNPRDVQTVPDTDGNGSAEVPSRLGHFEIVGRLGEGGMGMVFEGRDAMLDRRVALKLLHPNRAGNPIAPSRILREAQALAKLSHPNVVTVYEVALAGDDPFIAMELVEGETLAMWMKQRHDWRDVLDVFIAVGRGLAAVHALGLVHRDVKPSNVLFDKQTGTPKLGDFGLVRPVDDQDEAPPIEDTALTTTLTNTGSVVGTPAYMAPEQRRGERVDARADQYSFAKTLREALEPVPAVMQPILARAMADQASERYADMNALLADLARVRRGNRGRWIVLGGGAALIAAAGVAWGLGRASAANPCPRPTARVAQAWTSRSGALQFHLASIDPEHGAQRFAAAAGVLDRGSERWADQHVDACQMARAGRSSDALLDRRMACLDRAILEIDDTVTALERATDRSTLDSAMKAAVGLPALDDCADTAALMELLPRPTNASQRTEADALDKESVAIDVAVRTSGTKDTSIADRALAAVTRARTLGDPETLARSLRSLASVQIENEAAEPSLATLREAITVASTAHDDRLVADLYTKLLAQLVLSEKLTDAKTLLPAAEAAVARTKASTEINAAFLQRKAEVLAANKETDAARDVIATAKKLLEDAGAATPTSPLRPELIQIEARAATLYANTKQWKEMADELEHVIALANAQYGPDHPFVMQLHHTRGVALRRLEDLEGSLAEFREAARIGEARLAPSPNLAMQIFAYGTSLMVLDRDSTAVFERSVAMARATMSATDPRLADPLGMLAAAYKNKERYDDALPLYNEQIEILEKRTTEPDDRLASAYEMRGDVGVQTHHCDRAIPDLEHAIQLYDQLEQAADKYNVMDSLSDCLLDVERWRDAIDITAQIMAASDASPEQKALAKFKQGKGRAWAGEVQPGIAEVKVARAEMVKIGTAEETLGIVDRWLADIPALLQRPHPDTAGPR